MSRAQRELEAFDNVFKALAHSTRRHILTVIEANGGSMPAGNIAERFSHSWPTTSRHLRVLENSGVVVTERRGRERYYAIDKGLLMKFGRGWFDYFEE